MITVRPAVASDPAKVAPKLRPEDVQEIAWMSGRTPLDVLSDGWEGAAECWAADLDGEPEILFGIAPTPEPGLGIIWFLGSDRLYRGRERLQFLRLCRLWLPDLLSRFPRLANYVHHKNQARLRWVRWMGGSVSEEPVVMGVGEQPFLLMDFHG